MNKVSSVATAYTILYGKSNIDDVGGDDGRCGWGGKLRNLYKIGLHLMTTDGFLWLDNSAMGCLLKT